MSKLLIFAASCCSLQQLFINLTQQQYGIVQHIFLIMYAKFHDPITKNTGFIKKKRIMICFSGFGPIKMGPPGATTHFRVFFENFFTNLLGNRFSWEYCPPHWDLQKWPFGWHPYSGAKLGWEWLLDEKLMEKFSRSTRQDLSSSFPLDFTHSWLCLSLLLLFSIFWLSFSCLLDC